MIIEKYNEVRERAKYYYEKYNQALREEKEISAEMRLERLHSSVGKCIKSEIKGEFLALYRFKTLTEDNGNPFVTVDSFYVNKTDIGWNISYTTGTYYSADIYSEEISTEITSEEFDRIVDLYTPDVIKVS